MVVETTNAKLRLFRFSLAVRETPGVLTALRLMPALLLCFIQAVPTFRSTCLYQYQTVTLHYSDAALGWLGLDSPADARAELDAIAPALQSHPAVLEALTQLFYSKG